MEPLDNKNEMICYLAAQGRSTAEIAESLGISKDTVRLKLGDERMQFEIKHLRYKLFGKDHRKRFNEILPHAIDATERILLDPNSKDRVRFAAAQEVMDRALGKPKQTVEHEGSLIRALIEKLDGKGENEVKALDGEFFEAPALNPNETMATDRATNPNLQVDEIDKWAKENL